MSGTHRDEKTAPIQVEVVNHPQPKNYELRASYQTVMLTVTNPYAQIAGPDALRERIRLSPATKAYVIGGSISQASDPNNASGAATAKPNGRLIPATNVTETIVEGQNDVWVAGATADLPFAIGYEIIRKVPQ